MEERIHPDDRAQLIEHQIEHGQFIYSLPQEQRNDYLQIFQIRMLNARQEYVNVISRHQVIQKDKNGVDDYGSDGSFTRSNTYGANQTDGYKSEDG